MRDKACPCGSPQTYATCCEPLLAGAAQADTPEQLMRSRYTAFGLGHIDYLIATHHPSQRRPDDRQTLAHTIAATEWLSLRVLNTVGNTVEFVAYYARNGDLGQLHEQSTFVQENGRWTYLNGLMLAPIQIGRNEPCWCGSGKKLKKCHGK